MSEIVFSAQTLPSLAFEALYNLNKLEREFAILAPSVNRRNKINIDLNLSEDRVNITAILPLERVNSELKPIQSNYTQLPLNTELVPVEVTSSFEENEGITVFTIQIVSAFKEAFPPSEEEQPKNWINIEIDEENQEAVLVASFAVVVRTDGGIVFSVDD